MVIKLLCVLPYNVLSGSMVWHAATHYYGLFNPAWHGWSSNYCVSSLTMSWVDLWCGVLLPIIMACLILLDMDGHQTTLCPPLQCPEWIYGVACCYPLLWLVYSCLTWMVIKLLCVLPYNVLSGSTVCMLLPIIMACLILFDMDGHQTTVCPPLQCPEWIYGVACCYSLLWLV